MKVKITRFKSPYDDSNIYLIKVGRRYASSLSDVFANLHERVYAIGFTLADQGHAHTQVLTALELPAQPVLNSEGHLSFNRMLYL